MGTFWGARQGHSFVDVPLVQDEAGAIAFLVHAHKHLVEPADKFLQGGVAKSEVFLKELTSLRKAFMRLKAYRNMHCHIELNDHTEEAYHSFVKEDFDGVALNEIDGGWFKMQRVVLDNIHVALQVELSKM